MLKEEQDAYKTCIEVNKVVFGPLLASKNPFLISRVSTYLLEQGLRGKVATQIFTEEPDLQGDALAEKINLEFVAR